MLLKFLPYLLGAVLLSGCSSQPEQAKKQERSALVTLAVSEARDVPYRIEAVGTVSPSSSVNIVSRTEGELREVLIRDGEHVKKGQLLFSIEKDPYEIALHQAQARYASDKAKLAKANDDYSRALKMNKGGFSSAAETDAARVAMVAAQSAVKEDDAAVEKAELDLSYCEIRSPIDGRAGDIAVDEGNVLTEQRLLVVVDAIQPAEVTFSVPEKHLPLIRRRFEENTLTVSASSKEGKPLAGSVVFVGNIDAETGTVPLKARFENKQTELWPGEFLKLHLQLDTIKNAVAVPNRTVMLGPDGPFVYVVGQDNRARIRLVSTGIENSGITVITQGLALGEQVVLEGHVRLRDGMSVRIQGTTPARGEK